MGECGIEVGKTVGNSRVEIQGSRQMDGTGEAQTSRPPDCDLQTPWSTLLSNPHSPKCLCEQEALFPLAEIHPKALSGSHSNV